MVVSRTPKKIEQDDGKLEAPFGQVFAEDPPDPAAEKKADEEARFTELQAEIARLHEQLETRESRDISLVSQQVQTDTFIPEKLMAIPDVNEDLNGYISANVQNGLIEERNRQGKVEFQKRNSKSLDDKIGELWADFAEEYPDYSGKGSKRRIEFAAENVVKRAVARGLDPNRYMFIARDRFMKDVAAEMDDIFGAPEMKDELDDEDFNERPAPRRRREARAAPRRDTRRRPREEEDDTGRTGGLFGGNDSGGPRPSQRDISGDSAGSMLEDIHAMQRKNGFL